jgi:hypothetical protein
MVCCLLSQKLSRRFYVTFCYQLESSSVSLWILIFLGEGRPCVEVHYFKQVVMLLLLLMLLAITQRNTKDTQSFTKDTQSFTKDFFLNMTSIFGGLFNAVMFSIGNTDNTDDMVSTSSKTQIS